MPVSKSPFEILGIRPDAEAEVVQAAYRALARKYHPDLNPAVGQAELNKRMTEINWAKHELEVDLRGWRQRQTSSADSAASARSTASQTPTGTSASRVRPQQPPGTITVSPPVVHLPGRAGASGTFEASAVSLSPGELRARFRQSGNIRLTRVSGADGRAQFRVEVVEDFHQDVLDSLVETIEVRASGYMSSKVFVWLAPHR
jgi:hypothetical protein